MKKQHLFITSVLVFIGLVFGIYQYFQVFEINNVSAVTVGTPNPGHTWSSMECNASSLCIDTVNNRLGLGTNVPQAKLHSFLGSSGATAYQPANTALILEGNDRTTLQFLIPEDKDAYVMWGTPAGGVRAYVGFSGGTTGTPNLMNIYSVGNYYFSGGNVGIKTTTPATALDVVGDIQVSQGIRLNTAGGGSQPTCSSSTRGTMWVVSQGSGISDTVYVCLKDSGGSYAWIIVSGGFVCGNTVTFTYRGSTVTYGTVSSVSGCWMDRNLGATQVATSETDSAAYGDLFQWGRLDDGHQLRASATTATVSTNNVPGHSSFIAVIDWRSPKNSVLWQPTGDKLNDPCPTGWRIPTSAEWDQEFTAAATISTAYSSSPLKLTAAGYRNYNGALTSVGTMCRYWSSTVNTDNSAYYLLITTTESITAYNKGSGMSVRCIKSNTH